MGIVSSTFASLAIRFAWNCQRFLDPRYRYIEASGGSASGGDGAKHPSDEVAIAPTRISVAPESALGSSVPSTKAVEHQVASAICLPAENNNSLHQENRHRRAAQHRYRKRPSSFDVSLIIRNRNKTGNTTPSGLVTHSTPSTLKRQPAPRWDSTSSSSSSNESSDSETEFMYASSRPAAQGDERLEEKSPSDRLESKEKRETEVDGSVEGDNLPEEFAMSAAEEAAFRMTVGRGHFSRSKKDRFLNHLRLEKRLNGLNKEFFELACRAHTRSLRRRHSGDLRRIV